MKIRRAVKNINPGKGINHAARGSPHLFRIPGNVQGDLCFVRAEPDQEAAAGHGDVGDAAPSDSTKAIVRIENVHDKTSQDIEFTVDFVAAALMLYCRTLRIPLPKSAQKSVEYAPDSVILRVQI